MMKKIHLWGLKLLSMIMLFCKFFLPIVAISALVNMVLFPADMELFMLLFWKTILTTIVTITIMLWGIRREKKAKTQSKIRLFWWYFLPMIPYIELLVIAVFEQDFLLFIEKLVAYLLTYALLAAYYTYAGALKKLLKKIKKSKSKKGSA